MPRMTRKEGAFLSGGRRSRGAKSARGLCVPTLVVYKIRGLSLNPVAVDSPDNLFEWYDPGVKRGPSHFTLHGSTLPRTLSKTPSAFLAIQLFAVLLLLLFFPLYSQAQSDFELRDQKARSHNPRGLKLVLRAKGARSTYHLFETIPIELVFSSSQPSSYAIELDEVMNSAGQSNKFEVYPESTVFLPVGVVESVGIICCEFTRRALSLEPIILTRELTDYLRFEKPGKYAVFLQTRRVFRLPGYLDSGPSKLVLTSNILTLTILPDDPEWDARRLTQTLRTLRDPHVLAGYAKAKHAVDEIQSESTRNLARQNWLGQSPLVRAQRALNALDTEEAIRERVKLMNMSAKEDISSQQEFGGGTVLGQPLFASTTRPDLVTSAMAKRAEEPSFPVDYDYVDWWTHFMFQRDHPDMFRFSHDGPDQQKRTRDYLAYRISADREIIGQLEYSISTKKGLAKEITALTIKFLKKDIADQVRP